jgi:signal transduction histidine kinase
MFWLGIVPILPMFTASRRWSYAWLLFSFVSLVLLYLAQLKGLVLQEIAIAQEALTFSATMIGLLCITEAILFMLYDAANAQSARKLQQKNRSLKTLSHDLHIANIQNARFLSTVSHEIRTPLNAVMGYMGLLRNATDLTRETSNYVRGADSSANHL